MALLKSNVRSQPSYYFWELIDMQNIMIEKVAQNVRQWRDWHTDHNLMHRSKNQITSDDDAARQTAMSYALAERIV